MILYVQQTTATLDAVRKKINKKTREVLTTCQPPTSQEMSVPLSDFRETPGIHYCSLKMSLHFPFK